MEMEKIRALAALMGEMGLAEITLEEGDDAVALKATCAAPSPAPQAVSPAAPVPEMTAAPAPVAAEPGTITVSSPMVGVFYAAPGPEEKVFVSVGSQVKQGDVLCIIEAMKLMNEITAEEDGVVTEVCIGNGQLVEFGQPLFRMRRP